MAQESGAEYLTEDVSALAQYNIDKVREIAEKKDTGRLNASFEDNMLLWERT